MHGRAALRGISLLLLIVVIGSVAQQPALSVTKKEVDAACAESRAQLDVYREARSAFEEASLAFEATLQEIAALEYKRGRVAEIVDRRRVEIEATQGRIEQLAVELYMQGGTGNPDLVLFADSLDELLTGSEFLAAVTEDDVGSLEDMLALRSDLERFQQELAEVDAELRVKQAEQKSLVDIQLAEADAQRAAWEKLSGRCQSLQTKYEQEQARIRAAQQARTAGRSAGVGAISGFACPFPGSSFIDSWGFPRSGGRRHKGVDMMGPWNGRLVASGSGVVYTGNGGLGGKTVWLIADNGYGYYYAHLNSFNVTSGQRVSAGDVVGYNGDSGNASGGWPHLHFEIHPGGRGAAAVNPYPTVAAACR